ncbi:MAG: hypothetical protein ACKVX7_20395 [Planctomycetota bacterium]
MNRDLKDLLSKLLGYGAEHMIVGAHALAAYGLVRATPEFEVWVRPTRANGLAVLNALKAFRAPLHDLTERDFDAPGVEIQIGLPPFCVQIRTQMPGLDFTTAWTARVKTRFAGEFVAVPTREHLIRIKRAAGGLQDMADVEWLEAQRTPPAPK